MTYASQLLSFDSLIYQYADCGDSPGRIDEWDDEDLEYLALLVQQELQRRSSKAGEGR